MIFKKCSKKSIKSVKSLKCEKIDKNDNIKRCLSDFMFIICFLLYYHNQ